MSRLRFPLILIRSVLLTLLLAASTVQADEASDLAQKIYDQPNGRDLVTQGRMVLTEKGRPPRIREIVTDRLDKSGGETANLIRFLDPEDIAGTDLLSIDKADGSTDQWLYVLHRGAVWWRDLHQNMAWESLSSSPIWMTPGRGLSWPSWPGSSGRSQPCGRCAGFAWTYPFPTRPCACTGKRFSSTIST